MSHLNSNYVADLHRVDESAEFSQQSLPQVVSATRVGQNQHRSPAAAAGRPQLAVLIGVPAAELVDAVQVVRRDDEAVELTQITHICIRQAACAVIVHCGLTPHTPERRAEGHRALKQRKYTEASAAKAERPLTIHRGAALSPTCEALGSKSYYEYDLNQLACACYATKQQQSVRGNCVPL